MAPRKPQREKFKPLLSATFDPERPIEFPIIASPKIDGFRCFTPNIKFGIHDTSSRKLIPLPNTYSRFMTRDFPGLDGEITVGDPCDPETFDRTKKAITTHAGEPDIQLWVFDITTQPELPFTTRYLQVLEQSRDWPEHMHPWEHFRVTCWEHLAAYEADCIARGYEGVMYRRPGGIYKWGRSTLEESILVKWKRLERSIATIVGFEEAMTNQNELVQDALGHAKRSSHQDGKMPLDTLGAFVCQDPEFPGVTFNVGTGEGLTADLRKYIWQHRPMIMGQRIRYEFQVLGTKERPRNPSYKGFVNDEELDLS